MKEMLESWKVTLSQLCKGTDYEAMINGRADGGDGVAIVPLGQRGPQRICVYPKKRVGLGLVIEMDVYKRVENVCPSPSRIKGNRPHFNDLDEETVLDVCKIFLNKK